MQEQINRPDSGRSQVDVSEFARACAGKRAEAVYLIIRAAKRVHSKSSLEGLMYVRSQWRVALVKWSHRKLSPPSNNCPRVASMLFLRTGVLAFFALALALSASAQDWTRLLEKMTKPAVTENGPTENTPRANSSSASTSAGSNQIDARADPRYVFSDSGSEVTDGKTGLTWRRCVEGMAWDGATCTGQPRIFNGLSRVLAYEKSLTGWRVPKLDELLSIVSVYPQHAGANTGIGGTDASAFPNLPAEAAWSSTLYYKDRGDRDRTKIVHFANGLAGFRDNGESGVVILIRTNGGKVSPGSANASISVVPKSENVSRANSTGGRRWTPSADGQEITDEATGLIWRRCAEGMSFRSGSCAGTAMAVDFTGALSRATSQAKLARTNWRLPDKDELLSIVDPSRFKMSIDISAFPGTPPAHFWTSHRTNSTTIYTVNFYNGNHEERYYTSRHHVRLVRESR